MSRQANVSQIGSDDAVMLRGNTDIGNQEQTRRIIRYLLEKLPHGGSFDGSDVLLQTQETGLQVSQELIAGSLMDMAQRGEASLTVYDFENGEPPIYNCASTDLLRERDGVMIHELVMTRPGDVPLTPGLA